MENSINPVRQIKIIGNPSLIIVEDLINDWLLNNNQTTTVIDITEITACESPTFLIQYTIETNLAKKVVPFKLVSEIKAKSIAGKNK